MGCPFTPTDLPPSSEARYFTLEPRPQPDAGDSLTITDLRDIDGQVDSLMLYLQAHEEDVDAIQNLSDLYLSHGWFEAALGPLARALQLDPSRRSLWVALDRAVEKSGGEKISDAELTRRAQEFVEAVRMWGQGC
jgi:predicted Zn-dependent protease